MSWTSLLLLPVCCVILIQATDYDHCHQKTVLRELYRSLYKAISLHAICDHDRPKTNVEVLNLGKPLTYSDYNPGRPSRFSQPGALPLSVVENALPLVDKIYPSGTVKYRMLTNQSTKIESYRFESFSSMYDYILKHMMLLPQNFTEEELLRAKFYLQELVPNPERVVRNETRLPRYLLYDHYRSAYLEKKTLKRSAIDTTRRHSSQTEFEQWGQRKLARLESDVEAAYNKWQAFGYKSDVEKQLQYFEDDIQEDKLMSAMASFKAAGQSSQKEAHLTVYPFTLDPADWFHQLEIIITESSDQLRYRKSLLLTQQVLLNSTMNELSAKTSVSVNQTLQSIQNNLAELRTLIDGGVEKLLHMEVECFTKVNLTVCGDIIGGHTAFRTLLEDISEHYAQAEYLKSILEGRFSAITVIQEKLLDVNSELQRIEAMINQAERAETATSVDMSTSSDADVSSCPDMGQIKFAFDSRTVNSEEYCQDEEDLEMEEEEGEEGGDRKMECVDIEVPANSTDKNIWNVHSCPIESELRSFRLLHNFTKLMNSVPIRVSASLQKVKVHRPWFQPSIFEDNEHFTLKQGRGDVSPGPLSSKSYNLRVAHSGQYLLPHYVSAFVVASNVKIFLPGMGAWNYSDYDSEASNVINILMKYSYAQVLTGGIGPFSFEMSTGEQYNFNIRRKDGGVMIQVPGGQVIAYVLNTVPKFPYNQTEPFLDPVECDDRPAGVSRRRRRSVVYEEVFDAPENLRQLARSLFAEELQASGDAKLSKDKEVVSAEYMEELIKDGEAKKERISKFIESNGGNSYGISETKSNELFSNS